MSGRELPEIIPVFPLTGVILLPGIPLPLHVFEPRYRNMVADARESGQVIGMIQPLVPRQDNAPPPDQPPENPELYTVGGAGWIQECRQAPDGRYMILLKGVARFRVIEELPLHRGYRRVRCTYDELAAAAGVSPVEIQAGPLLEALEAFGAARGLAVDRVRLSALEGAELLHTLVMALPFSAVEKQALLEAPTPEDRCALLMHTLTLNVSGKSENPHSPPTMN